jgi:hypothetical protein
MLTPEQTIDMQRRTIEALHHETEDLKEQLDDYRELQRQKAVAQQVGFTESSIWSQPLVITGWVAFVAATTLVFYRTLAPGTLGMALTIATIALLVFGIAYAAQRDRSKKHKEYMDEYRRQYGSTPRYVAEPSRTMRDR